MVERFCENEPTPAPPQPSRLSARPQVRWRERKRCDYQPAESAVPMDDCKRLSSEAQLLQQPQQTVQVIAASNRSGNHNNHTRVLIKRDDDSSHDECDQTQCWWRSTTGMVVHGTIMLGFVPRTGILVEQATSRNRRAATTSISDAQENSPNPSRGYLLFGGIVINESNIEKRTN